MSLNQFLAVGKSFVGIRGEKSPFEMKKDCLLPRFEPAPRFAVKRFEATGTAPEQGALQRDWVEEVGEREVRVEPLAAPRLEAPVVGSTAAASVPPQAALPRNSRSWVAILTFGLLGKKRKSGHPLVQGELSLEKVRVIRNDLSDSDLELVPKERPRARKAGAAARSFSTTQEEQPWTKLASRLF